MDKDASLLNIEDTGRKPEKDPCLHEVMCEVPGGLNRLSVLQALRETGDRQTETLLYQHALLDALAKAGLDAKRFQLGFVYIPKATDQGVESALTLLEKVLANPNGYNIVIQATGLNSDERLFRGRTGQTGRDNSYLAVLMDKCEERDLRKETVFFEISTPKLRPKVEKVST